MSEERHHATGHPTAVPVVGRFAFGRRILTADLIEALQPVCGNDDTINIEVANVVVRHIKGDWGDVDAVEKAANDAAIANEGEPCPARPVRSAYSIRGIRVWVVTENPGEGNVTTVLRAEDHPRVR